MSAIIMLGSGLGFALSQALKSDKGGMLSADLLLFGIMTIWLPPVRQALVHYPLPTISLLLCLALIFKFGQQGGRVGLLTGGVLTLYVIAVIIVQTPQLVPGDKQPSTPEDVAPPPIRAPHPLPSAPSVPQPPPPGPTGPAKPPAPEIRELIASKGAILKFVSGVPYRLKIRAGFTTLLVAVQGAIAPFQGRDQTGACAVTMTLDAPESTIPYSAIDATLRACGSSNALVRVGEVR